MTIATGISATKTGFDLIKSVRELVKRPEIDAREVSARLLELQELMLDARSALSEAADEKVRLEARLAELTRMAEIGKDFVSEEGVYWFARAPYCPICWDVKREPVRLSGPLGSSQGINGRIDWSCSIHKATFGITRSKSQQVTSTAE